MNYGVEPLRCGRRLIRIVKKQTNAAKRPIGVRMAACKEGSADLFFLVKEDRVFLMDSPFIELWFFIIFYLLPSYQLWHSLLKKFFIIFYATVLLGGHGSSSSVIYSHISFLCNQMGSAFLRMNSSTSMPLMVGGRLTRFCFPLMKMVMYSFCRRTV